MNSTAYSTYEMEVNKDGQPLLKQLTVFSSVLYWPFTSSGPYQFSWLKYIRIIKIQNLVIWLGMIKYAVYLYHFELYYFHDTAWHYP